MARWDLGGQIKELRLKRGWTQAELAEATTLSLVYIRKLEQGKRTSPSLPALERIAQVLHAELRVELVARRKGSAHGC